MEHTNLGRRATAEAVGTGLLVLSVVGSGIMASRLSPDDVGLQLLENAAATAGALVALILTFGHVSGAHFNPSVTLVERLHRRLTSTEAGAYVLAQVLGGCAGALLANVMFELPAIDLAQNDRVSGAILVSEAVATAALLIIIHGAVSNGRPNSVAYAVGLWIGGAYFFTSSTSFANPAVTAARTLSDTFTGISPASAAGFVAVQIGAAVLIAPLLSWLFARPTSNEGTT